MRCLQTLCWLAGDPAGSGTVTAGFERKSEASAFLLKCIYIRDNEFQGLETRNRRKVSAIGVDQRSSAVNQFGSGLLQQGDKPCLFEVVVGGEGFDRWSRSEFACRLAATACGARAREASRKTPDRNWNRRRTAYDHPATRVASERG